LKRIVYGEFYRDPRIFDLSAQLGIKLDLMPAAEAKP
jgi:hypothetical protein